MGGPTVLVSLGRHNKTTEVVQTTDIYSLTALEAQVQDRDSDQFGSGEGSLPGSQVVTFQLCHHMAIPWYICAEREQAYSSLMSLLIRALILPDEG